MNDTEMNCQLKEFYDQGSPLQSTPKEILESTIVRIAETTLGYTLTVLSGLIFLLAILPHVYCFFETLSKLSEQDAMKVPNHFVIFSSAFGGLSGILINLHLLGFFIGGIGLRTARSWARPLLIYLLTYLGLIILFEIRYSGPIIPQGEGWISMLLLTGVLISGIWFLSLYRKKNLHFIRACALLNLVLAGLLIVTVIRHFIYLPFLPGDRHLQYLSLFFFAILLVETVGTIHIFIPALVRGSKDPE